MNKRIIFHIDVNNAFLSWSAVYLLKNGYKQDIRTIPSVIGGDEKMRHGIVLAKSPVAKKFGVITAETLYSAKKKCPSLKVFPPNHDFYDKCSKELFAYLKNFSPQLEQFSIDECFIDMTGTTYLYKDYLKLANDIKEEVKKRFGFTVNVGIGNNKLCAKMASDFEKPDKVHTLFNDEVKEKMWPLDVGELFMVGKKTKEELNKISIYTVRDLANADIKILKKYFKNHAEDLKRAAWGIDDSKIETKTKSSSISTSQTFAYDITDEEKLKSILFQYANDLTRQLRSKKQYANTVAVIFKNNNFKSYTAQAKLNNATNETKEIYNLAISIFDKNYKKEPIRLIGLRLAELSFQKETQLTLFDKAIEEKKADVQMIVDSINEKFGKTLVAPASLRQNIALNKNKSKNK